MKKRRFAIIAVILLIVAILAVFLFTFLVSSESPWIDPDTGEPIGTFYQKFTVEYTDGTTEELKLTNTPVASIFYNNKPIESISYSLFAKTNKGTVEVDTSDYATTIEIKDSANQVVREFQIASADKQVTVDTTDKVIDSWSRAAFSFINYTYTDGTYIVGFSPFGTLKYNPGSGWKSSSLPQPIALEVGLKDDRVINLVFRSGE